MRLTKDQADAVFSLIRDEVNSQQSKRVREIKKENRRLEAEALEKFKLTEEYKAVMLLSKKFKGTHVGDIYKYTDTMARWMFEPKTKHTTLSSWNTRETIQLLAIDCKNLSELKEKLNVHYSLKKRIK